MANVTTPIKSFATFRFQGNRRFLVFEHPNLESARHFWDENKLFGDMAFRLIEQYTHNKTGHVYLEITQHGFNLEK